MNDQIKTWRGLVDFTGMTEGLLRRLVAFHGFPKPDLETTKYLKRYIWNKNEVENWLNTYTVIKSKSSNSKVPVRKQ